MGAIWKTIQVCWRAVLLLGTWIGLLFLPKNIKESGEAAKEWEALLPPISQDTALIVFSGALVLWIIGRDVWPFYARWRDERRTPPFEIEFFNDVVNDKSKRCRNKVARLVFPKGLSNEPPLQQFIYKIGIVNNLPDKTLRRVNIMLHSISNPSVYCDSRLPPDNSSDGLYTDIPPKHTAYFVLGHTYQREIVGGDEMGEIDPLAYKLFFGAGNLGGLQLATEHTLLRNDGVELEIGVYVDDMLPLRGKFVVDLKNGNSVRYMGLITDPV